MPELREVFEMTTKQIDIEVEDWREQERRQRKRQRNRRFGGLAAAAAIGIAAITIAVLSSSGDQEGPPPVATTTPAGRATAPFLFDLTSGERTPLPDAVGGEGTCHHSVSPDGTHVTYGTPCSSDATDDNTLMLADIDGPGLRQVPVPDGLIAYAGAGAWSPDGNRFVYQVREPFTQDVGDLYVYDVAAGEATRLTDLRHEPAGGYELHAAFSPDGETVFFDLPRETDRDERDIWSVPVTGGTPTLVARNAAYPMFVDGAEIAFVVPDESGFFGRRIVALSDDGTRRTLLVTDEPTYFPTASPDGDTILYYESDGQRFFDVASGSSTPVPVAGDVWWVDDDTLLVAP